MNISSNTCAPVKIAVVGAGNVGTSCAYALLLRGVASEIVLVDANRARAQGEAMDLQHAAPFAPSARVREGGVEECEGALVTVVTAGANQKPGESRLELLQKNAGIFEQLIPQIAQANPNGLLLIATNPVDVLTTLSARLSGLPAPRVLGSGTILDTARFRHFIGERLGVAPQSISAYIIGEHGDSSVPVWSSATVAGVPLDDFGQSHGLSLAPEDKDAIYAATRDAAQHIIARKGATHLAIGAAMAEIVAAIVRDENAVLPVGSLIEGYEGASGLAFGMPTVINRSGAARVLPLRLDEAERQALQRSLQVLGEALAHVHGAA